MAGKLGGGSPHCFVPAEGPHGHLPLSPHWPDSQCAAAALVVVAATERERGVASASLLVGVPCFYSCLGCFHSKTWLRLVAPSPLKLLSHNWTDGGFNSTKKKSKFIYAPL